jgi:hypothetical protein
MGNNFWLFLEGKVSISQSEVGKGEDRSVLAFGDYRWAGVSTGIFILSIHSFARVKASSFLEAVTLLQLTYQLVARSRDVFNVVVGEFSPLLFRRSFELFLFAFNLVPIHGSFLSRGYRAKMTRSVIQLQLECQLDLAAFLLEGLKRWFHSARQ